jgi:hypothetical protein
MSAAAADAESSGTSITAMVSERECTSARDPSPYLNDRIVVESDNTVTVYWTSTPPDGAQYCTGNPSVERRITLTRPLGNRTLLDGSTWPPTPVTFR